MQHLLQAWDYCVGVVNRHRLDTAEQAARERNELALQLWAEAEAEKRQAKEAVASDTSIDDPDSVVYYLRFADRVKIGYSRNLGRRMADLPHDELMAIEFGARQVEARRHKQFAAYRIVGEWFSLSPEILAHVEDLRVKQADRTKYQEKLVEMALLAERRSDEEVASTIKHPA